MDEATEKALREKNERLIDMVVERAKRDFPEDIAIIGLTGSFSTGDFHEKSDLDLIIINNTERGWEIGDCFILGDVGYDIYCTPWETRIEAEASLTSPLVSCLLDMKILYCAKPEYMDRLDAYKARALEALAKPIGPECIERARRCIDAAKQEYVNALLADDLSDVRFACGKALRDLIDAVVHLNNTYIKRGVKRYPEELKGYAYLPDGFMENYMAVIEAKDVQESREASYRLLRSVAEFRDAMRETFVPKPVPTVENLRGTYEELWCNYRNKIAASAAADDESYAYHAAIGAQDFLDEMTQTRGTKKLRLLRFFDPDNLRAFKDRFFDTMDEYLEEYGKVGRSVEAYASFEQLYDSYMREDGKAQP